MWDMQNIYELIRDRRTAIMAEEETDYVTGNFSTHQFSDSIEQVDVVTSHVHDIWHRPILDIDFEAFLVPSSTNGHYHLYLNKFVTWRNYKRFLRVAWKAGIIEEGYYKASVKRGYASARLPWIKKEEPVL